ncbi:MAG: aldo/keto reductase [Pseudomonadota bacterium]|nr:aldo/keto reductase [Pseudomonadota bacterium]
MSDSYFTPRDASSPAAGLPEAAPLTLGTMNFGKRTPEADARRIMARAVDAGIELFDTANVYSDGTSERIVGAFLRGRTGIDVATKVGLGRLAGRSEGLSRARIVAACDESLGRLGIDTIALYYLHAPDADTPMEDTLAGIADLLERGRIRRWGVSNFASWQILELRALASAAGLPPPAVAQQLYNVLVRQLDVEYFAYARRHPIHTTVYNPLAGGLLAGARHFEQAPPKGSRFDVNALYRRRYWQRALFAAVDDLRGIAADAGLSLLELAYTFVARHPGVDSVLVGPGSVAHLDDAIAAREKPLDPETRRRVDAVYVNLVGTDARYAR